MNLCSLITDEDRILIRLAGWSDSLDKKASDEGWGIFECSDSLNGQWQIQALADGPLEGDDSKAFKLICSVSTPLHRAAIAFMERHNPIEIKVIEEWMSQGTWR